MKVLGQILRVPDLAPTPIWNPAPSTRFFKKNCIEVILTWSRHLYTVSRLSVFLFHPSLGIQSIFQTQMQNSFSLKVPPSLQHPQNHQGCYLNCIIVIRCTLKLSFVNVFWIVIHSVWCPVSDISCISGQEELINLIDLALY